MADKKITQLTATTEIQSSDIIPVVDVSAAATKKATMVQVLEYITGSIFNNLTASNLTGSDAKYTTLSASYITASVIYANEYNVVTVNRTTLSQEGNTKFGDDSGDTHQFSGSIYVSGNVSGSRAEFTSLTGALDWSYVENTPTTLTGYGITDSVTLDTEQTINGRKTFTTHYITASITGSDAKFTNLSGNLLWSYISGAPAFITSNQTITLSGDATGSGTTDISVGDVSASFIKAGTDGSNLTSLTASQLSNFTNDVRAQFTAGTNITINNGEISASGDVTLAGNNTFSGTNTFSQTITGSITGSTAELTELTSSNFNSKSPAVFVNSAGVTGTTPAFSLQTDSTVSGYLLEVKNNTAQQLWVRYDGYTYIGDTLAVRNALLLSTPTFGATQVASYRNYLKNARFMASGSSTISAVRIGSENNSSDEKLLSIGRNLYSTSPVDVMDVYGNGDVDISGSLITNIRVSGSVASPINVTSYTLSPADRGKTLLLSNSSQQTIACPSGLNVGFSCTFVQMGTGQIVLSAGGGVTLVNRQSHTGTAGQYSAMSLVVIDTGVYLVAGDTA